jgi:ADP-ribose pyrophosphatase
MLWLKCHFLRVSRRKKAMLETKSSDEFLASKVLGSERLFEGKLIKIDALHLQQPDGRITTHEVVRHPGAVAVIAIDGQGKILMLRQYRSALERVVLEIPAGKLEAGEDASHCAYRELEEETGYRATDMRYLAPIAIAIGYSDEIIHFFLASGLKPGEAHPDDGEFIACEWVELRDLVDAVLDGKVEDSKTVIAALLCDAIKHRL